MYHNILCRSVYSNVSTSELHILVTRQYCFWNHTEGRVETLDVCIAEDLFACPHTTAWIPSHVALREHYLFMLGQDAGLASSQTRALGDNCCDCYRDSGLHALCVADFSFVFLHLSGCSLM